MTLTQLEYLIALDTYGSFARAAKHCRVTQPTMSMQIKKMEEELDVLIFDRSKKPVITTDVGRSIIEQARIVVQESKRIGELIKFKKGEIRGTLRIGIIPTLSPYLLPMFISSFLESYPEVKLVVEELLSDQIIYKLKNDLLDVGLLVSPLDDAQVVEIPLFYETFVLYTASDKPIFKKSKIKFDDLNINDMWLLEEGHCFRSQVINICEKTQPTPNRQLRFESGSLETLRRIVDRQSGYTLLPELATLELNEEDYKKVRHFKNPQPVREVSLVIHRSFMKRQLIGLLKENILSNIPDILKDTERGKRIEWRT